MTDEELPTAAVFRDDQFFLKRPIQMSADPDVEEELVRRERVREIMKVLENQPDMSHVEMWSELKASVEKKNYRG